MWYSSLHCRTQILPRQLGFLRVSDYVIGFFINDSPLEASKWFIDWFADRVVRRSLANRLELWKSCTPASDLALRGIESNREQWSGRQQGGVLSTSTCAALSLLARCDATCHRCIGTAVHVISRACFFFHLDAF